MSARDYGEEDPRDRPIGWDEPPECDTCGVPTVGACQRCAKIEASPLDSIECAACGGFGGTDTENGSDACATCDGTGFVDAKTVRPIPTAAPVIEEEDIQW